jgi:hypothetical protein
MYDRAAGWLQDARLCNVPAYVFHGYTYDRGQHVFIEF